MCKFGRSLLSSKMVVSFLERIPPTFWVQFHLTELYLVGGGLCPKKLIYIRTAEFKKDGEVEFTLFHKRYIHSVQTQ